MQSSNVAAVSSRECGPDRPVILKPPTPPIFTILAVLFKRIDIILDGWNEEGTESSSSHEWKDDRFVSYRVLISSL